MSHNAPRQKESRIRGLLIIQNLWVLDLVLQNWAVLPQTSYGRLQCVNKC